MDNVFKLHGVPSSIISNRDRIFLSNFWKELFKLLGTELKMSSAYHPQTDGQTKMVNRCLETYLRCMTCERPKIGLNGLLWQSGGITPHTTQPLTPHHMK